jgi:16S rRNA (guanine527-N7)-methyltransferase
MVMHTSQNRFSEANVEQRLTEGAMALNLAVDPEGINKLAKFVGLLAKWSRVYNLTSVRRPKDIVCRHILDSLAIVPYLEGQHVLDLGTGAGLPGIPLAAVRPDITVTLLDSNAKKLRFVRHVMAELKMDNIRVRHCKMEDYRPVQPFDTVVCRAFSSLADIVRHASDVCTEDGQILAMKGVYPLAEIEELDDPDWVEEVVSVTVPGLDAQRHIVILSQPE